MNIEERAKTWADEYQEMSEDYEDTFSEALVRAYLAGSAQTQADYNASGYGSV
jgi:hypothetical protein